MNAPRFSDDELLALIEGDLPQRRTDEMRAALRDGDLDLAARLIDMAEHRDFLRELKIDRSELNPGGAGTPAGVVAAAIAVAEREALVPAKMLDASERKSKMPVILAGAATLAAMIAMGLVIFHEPAPQHTLPANIEQLIESGQAGVIGSEEDFDTVIAARRADSEQDEWQRMAREFLDQTAPLPDFEWPEFTGTPEQPGLGVPDPFERDAITFQFGTGLSELLSEQELSGIVASLSRVGVRTEPQSADPLRFAGIDALGDEREFTLEEAASLAKTGRLAIMLDQTRRQPNELLAASGGYVAGQANRFALFTIEGGVQQPEGVGALRESEQVRELRDRTADVIGQQPSVLASYSFDAAGLSRRVSDAERVTMLELIAAVTSPVTSSANGSRLVLFELPFGGDEQTPTSADPNNPFWWLTPEEDWSETATTLVPVVVR